MNNNNSADPKVATLAAIQALTSIPTIPLHSIIGPLVNGQFPTPIFPSYPNYPAIGGSIHAGMGLNSIGMHFPKYKWFRGFAFPQHLFTPTTKLIPALQCCNAFSLMFHTSVWIECEQPDPSQYGIVWENSFEETTPSYKSSALQGVLLINEGPTLDSYKSWEQKYFARFMADNWKTQLIPLLKEAEEISGFPIRHNELASRFDGCMVANDSLYDKWLWIVQNTDQPVLYVDEFWLFSNKAEMIMYKLMEEK